jgi:hypothetical protein
MSNLSAMSVTTIIRYPRQAQVGRTYLMTIDLEPDENFDWGYEEEEYPIYCSVESDAFHSKVVGTETVVLHRFGGSYGPARFLLTTLQRLGDFEIKVNLIDDWGARIQILSSQVEVMDSNQSSTQLKEISFYQPTEFVSITNDKDGKLPFILHPDYSKRFGVVASLNQRKSETTSQEGSPETPLHKISQFKSPPPKVFISYIHDSVEQMDLVLSLADHLREEGIDCNIDQYEELPMKGWYRWMIDEIEASDFVLMICTSRYIRSFRANKENKLPTEIAWEGAIITQDIYVQEKRKSKYIPIVFASQDIDLIPNILRRTSVYNMSAQNGRKLLCHHLAQENKNLRPKLGDLHSLPVLNRKQFFNAHLKKDNFKKRENHNLPYRKSGDFIGRKKEISILLARISPDYRQHINVVRGIGGVGKTALALEVAHLCWEARNTDNSRDFPIFDAIIFTSSKATNLVNNKLLNRPEKEPLLTDIFRVISDVLDEPTITQVLPEDQKRKVNKALSKQSTLLIVDNMETLSEKEQSIVLSFLNEVPISTQVIITTRGFLGFDGILINSLTQQESFELLSRQASIKHININNSWKKQIYRRFSGIPIALIYAMGKVAAGYQLSDIVNSKEIVADDLGRFCFESSIESIKNTKAYQLLLAMTLFGKSSRRSALIKTAGLADNNLDVIDALAKLQQLSLVTDEENGRYSILSITREYAILELEKKSNLDFNISARDLRDRWYAWYLNFTEDYGGQDWENWRAKYDRLDEEWENIQLVLNWYAEKANWDKILHLWENLDNYADLSGYWQDRRYWWALLMRNHGSARVQVKALSEIGFTLILMGGEYHVEAEEYLARSWDISQGSDELLRSNIANNLAILAMVKMNYETANRWLDVEEELLNKYQQDTREREKKRYQIRNLYYRAETNYLLGNINMAELEFTRVIELSREIGWQRFRNYAKNILAEIYIIKGDLESAKVMITTGLASAYQSRERRRIALYHASHARLSYRLARDAGAAEESKLHINESKEYLRKAMKTFSKEFMRSEMHELEQLIALINEYESSA